MRKAPTLALITLILAAPTHLFSQPTQYVQNFDAVTPPELPPGWSSPEATWTTSTSVSSPGSGGNNVENRGNSPGAILSPVFDFSNTTLASISYSARRTATYDSLNLQVEASVDGGNTWTIVVIDSTGALPVGPSTYATVSASVPAGVHGQTAVRFRFNARNPTGGNVRIDDVEIAADEPIPLNRFGFSPGSSSTIEGTTVVFPIGLSLIPSSDNLQGLQFGLVISSGLSFSSITPGIPILDTPEWHVSHEANGEEVRVVAISEGTDGLQPISTDSLLLVAVDVLPLEGMPARVDSIRIQNLVASTASETADDIFFTIDSPLHLLQVLRTAPQLSIDSAHVNFGTIAQDSTAQAVLTVTNTGSSDLEILDMYSISGLLGIDPAFLVLSPDSSAAVTLSASGASYGSGAFQDRLIVEHNGSTSPDTLEVTGTVVSTESRGDANNDGAVDIVDLVLGIDLILGRIDLSETALRLDLHPFPGGNGSVDVRDLTVLAQAIARGIWPDGKPIPSQESQLAKKFSNVGDLVVSRDDATVALWIRSTEPLRAVHVVGRTVGSDPVIHPNPNLPAVQVGRPYAGSGADSFSLLTFGIDDLPVGTDAPVLLATIETTDGSGVEVLSSIAVDRHARRRALLSIEETSEDPSQTEHPTFDSAYPNPVDPAHTALVHFPLNLNERTVIRLTVRDVLGRTLRTTEQTLDRGKRVTVWDLKSGAGLVVPAGLYFVTASSPTWRRTQAVAVR